MRKTTNFTGGFTNAGIEMAAQPVRIIACQDDVEDIWRVTGVTDLHHDVYGCDLSPHPEEPELNTEFMTRMMEYGNPLVQGFVIEAVEKYSRMVLTMSDEDKAAMDGGFIPYGAWQQCAQQCLGLIVARDVERQERNKELTPTG